MSTLVIPAVSALAPSVREVAAVFATAVICSTPDNFEKSSAATTVNAVPVVPTVSTS